MRSVLYCIALYCVMTNNWFFVLDGFCPKGVCPRGVSSVYPLNNALSRYNTFEELFIELTLVTQIVRINYYSTDNDILFMDLDSREHRNHYTTDVVAEFLMCFPCRTNGVPTVCKAKGQETKSGG